MSRSTNDDTAAEEITIEQLRIRTLTTTTQQHALELRRLNQELEQHMERLQQLQLLLQEHQQERQRLQQQEDLQHQQLMQQLQELQQDWPQFELLISTSPLRNNNTASPESTTGTSRDFLDGIPRDVLEEGSSLVVSRSHTTRVIRLSFRDSSSSSDSLQIVVTVSAVFGPFLEDTCTDRVDVRVVVAKPRTRSGSSLTTESLEMVLRPRYKDAIMYMPAEGNVETVHRSLLAAQGLGVAAVVLGSTDTVDAVDYSNSSLFPTSSLQIPIFFVEKSDGQEISFRFNQTRNDGIDLLCSLTTETTTHSPGNYAKCCPICQGDFQVSETVMRLPPCFHCFHEDCVLPWLTHKITCPVCRTEFPTEIS